MTFGYSGEVLLPVTMTGATGPLTAHAQWLVCKVLRAGGRRLQSDLPAGTPAPRPRRRCSPTPTARAAPLAVARADRRRRHPVRAGPELTPATVTDAWFTPDEPGAAGGADQPTSVRAAGLRLTLKPGPDSTRRAALRRAVRARRRPGMQAAWCSARTPGDSAAAPAMPPLAPLLVFAFLGGLILNLMPCVFPILAMKAVSLRAAPRTSGARRRCTCAVLCRRRAGDVRGLAAALLAPRAAGGAAGWGFQFQSPVFVASWPGCCSRSG